MVPTSAHRFRISCTWSVASLLWTLAVFRQPVFSGAAALIMVLERVVGVAQVLTQLGAPLDGHLVLAIWVVLCQLDFETLHVGVDRKISVLPT